MNLISDGQLGIADAIITKFYYCKSVMRDDAVEHLTEIGYLVLHHMFLKFIYSEKTTKFCEIFNLLLSYGVPVKSKVKISQTFVAFSYYMNFIYLFYAKFKLFKEFLFKEMMKRFILMSFLGSS